MSDQGGAQAARGGFWNSDKLKQHGPEIISGFAPDRVQCNAYELSVANEYFETSMEDGKDTVPKGKQIIINPGQLALLITEETVQVPPTTMGFISIKFRAKFRGLINVSGFHVDPGFKGRLKFSVYNAGSEEAVFDPGQELFVIWFADLTDKEPEPYKGDHQGQESITGEDVSALQGYIASPGQLKEEMIQLRKESDKEFAKVKWHQRLHTLVFTVCVGVFLLPQLKGCRENTAARTKPAGIHETGDARGAIDINLNVRAEGSSEETPNPEASQSRSKKETSESGGKSAGGATNGVRRGQEPPVNASDG